MLRNILAVLALGLTLISCGGKGSSTGGTSVEEGRVYLQNDTHDVLTVTYYSDNLGEVITKVSPGERKDVCQEALPFGTKVVLHVVSRGSPDYKEHTDYPTRQDVEVIVEGIMVVRMYGLLRGGYGIEYEIRIEG